MVAEVAVAQTDTWCSFSAVLRPHRRLLLLLLLVRKRCTVAARPKAAVWWKCCAQPASQCKRLEVEAV